MPFFILVIAVWTFAEAPARDYRCSRAANSLVTSWGQENVVIEHEPVKVIRGVVQVSDGNPADGVFVEVYDRPEVVLRDSSPSRKGQRRLAACTTGPNGRFSFKMAPGRYEVRCSKPLEWNVTSVLLEVSRKKGSTEALEVPLELAR